MEPFFFGERKLLGLYHPAAGLAKNIGVLICPPILGEYMRTHGCLRQLAVELAALGHHVLRFDYSGTGDSGGDIQAASVSGWLDEVCIASGELQAIAGVENIAVVGVRFGAALAASAANDCPAITHLVLWDPVDDGSVYLRGVIETYEALIASHEYLAAADLEDARSVTTGYALADSLLQGIGAFRFPDGGVTDGARLSVLLTDKTVFDSGRWQGRTTNCRLFEHECNWTTFSESVIFGRPLIKELAQQV